MISYGTEHWSAGSRQITDEIWTGTTLIPVTSHTFPRWQDSGHSFQFSRRHPSNPSRLSRPTHCLSNVRKRTVYANRQSLYEPMDIPIDECGGERPKLQGLAFNIEPPTGVSPQIPLLTTLEVSKQIAPNSTVVLTCAAKKTSSDLQTVTVNIGGEPNLLRLVGSLPRLGVGIQTMDSKAFGQANIGVPKSSLPH